MSVVGKCGAKAAFTGGLGLAAIAGLALKVPQWMDWSQENQGLMKGASITIGCGAALSLGYALLPGLQEIYTTLKDKLTTPMNFTNGELMLHTGLGSGVGFLAATVASVANSTLSPVAVFSFCVFGATAIGVYRGSSKKQG